MAPSKLTPHRSPRLALLSGCPRKKPVSRSVKAGLHFPAGRIGRYLKEGGYAQRIRRGAPVYLATVLEYLTTEVLEVAGRSAMDNKRKRIIPRDVLLGIRADKEIHKMLAGVTVTHGGVVPYIHVVLLPKKTKKTAATARMAAKTIVVGKAANKIADGNA